jgi:hypothetical protein
MHKRSLVRRINMLSDPYHVIVSGTAAIYFVPGFRVIVISPERAVDKLAEVETAKELMTEAMRWSVIKWLREKKRVRHTADQANATLDELSDSLIRNWPADLRDAYNALTVEGNGKSPSRSSEKSAPQNGSAQRAIVKRFKDADDEAYRARMDAEKAFDEAEKKLSTAMAREGCLKAIRAWELKEKAIRQARQMAGR